MLRRCYAGRQALLCQFGREQSDQLLLIGAASARLSLLEGSSGASHERGAPGRSAAQSSSLSSSFLSSFFLSSFLPFSGSPLPIDLRTSETLSISSCEASSS